MARREFDLQAMFAPEVYRLLTAVIIPRPIAWVLTRSPEGVDNLAPHSFFTVASDRPPVVQFTSVGIKDTLRNVLATRELVIHLAPESLLEEVNATSVDAPRDVSEVDLLGLTREPAAVVSLPRIANSPVAIEARLRRTVEVGRCTIVLADVVHIAIDENVLDMTDPGRPQPNSRALAPLARLGGEEWATLGEIVTRSRPRWDGDAYAER